MADLEPNDFVYFFSSWRYLDEMSLDMSVTMMIEGRRSTGMMMRYIFLFTYCLPLFHIYAFSFCRLFHHLQTWHGLALAASSHQVQMLDTCWIFHFFRTSFMSAFYLLGEFGGR